jgi:preprotein translocase subunit YajC
MNDIGALLVMSLIFLVLVFCFMARRRNQQRARPIQQAGPRDRF